MYNSFIYIDWQTRRDSEVGGNDAAGERGNSLGCSSRPPASSSSNEGTWRENQKIQERKGSGLFDDETKLTLEGQRLVISDTSSIIGNEKREEREERSSDVSGRQSFRRKVIEATSGCVPASSATLPNTAILSTASGSSTPAGETRLSASILFDLPESCGASSDVSMKKMPAITKAQMKGPFICKSLTNKP